MVQCPTQISAGKTVNLLFASSKLDNPQKFDKIKNSDTFPSKALNTIPTLSEIVRNLVLGENFAVQ